MKKTGLVFLLFISFLAAGCGSSVRIAHTVPVASATVFESLPVVSPEEWKGCARRNGINFRSGKSRNPVTVLGHYPEYVELTEELGAESMQIPMEQWDRMTPEEQWRTTTGFFDRMIRDGHNFRLATPVEKARPGSFYVRELHYLFDKGYRLSPCGRWLVK